MSNSARDGTPEFLGRPPQSPPTLPRRVRNRQTDRDIARLAVPAFAALVSEPLFLLADAAIVGHLGTAQLAALGIAGTVVQTAVGLFVFLAYGTTSSVSRSMGADEKGTALGLGIDGLWLALVIGATVAFATAVLTPAIVEAFGPDPAVRAFAVIYLRIASFGILALLLMFAATGVLRGLQDTKTPLAVAVVANLVNIGLNLLFVFGFGWGIAGSATGTVVAQGLASIVMASVVIRTARKYGASLAPHQPGVIAAWRSGVPLIVRTLTLRVALLLATYVAATISTSAIAAHQVAFTLWSFLAFALDAIAIAGQAITGRLLGAGDAAGARFATRRMMWWGVVCGTVLGLLLAATRPLVVPLFSPDLEVQQQLAGVLLIVALHQPVSGVVFVLDGVLIGAGDGRYLAWAGVLGLLAFTPMALAVAWTDGGLNALWWTFSGFMCLRMFTLLYRERSDRWLVLGAAASTRDVR